MSQFYASIRGSRGEATRQGSKKSGITGHVRGWNIGAQVTCDVDDEGRDCVVVSITGGSRGVFDRKFLGTFYRDARGRIRRKK